MSLTEFSGNSVLVVDDEPMVREVVSAYLIRDGFSVTEIGDGQEALEHMSEQPTDLIILDIMLPGTDGLAVLSHVRARTDTPVILLSARGEEVDRVLGLELGADDYVVKPFSPRELATRVRTVLRRTSHTQHRGKRLAFDNLTIDPRLREVQISGRAVDLTPKEFDLLFFLASSPRQVFSRGQILDHVWNSGSDWQDPSTVTVHIRRLRQRIEDDPGSPQRLVTVWGVGYRFEP
ncbi:MAG: response regulator transcription factor [Acidimicrobiia bacterium]|jgi:DNA-binding response OmpR family regulator